MEYKVEYQSKYCYCTLALGVNYCYLAKQLAEDLKQFAPETMLLILTDHPTIFTGLDNVVVIYHQRRSVIGYNDKLCVVKKALDLFDTCIFLDADIRIIDRINLESTVFTPGIAGYKVYTWQYFKDALKLGGLSWDKKLNARIMKFFRSRLKLEYADNEIPAVWEGLFSVTRCPEIDPFLRKWNDLAELCEKNAIFAHEGFSIGLAGLLTGFPTTQNEFQGFHFFELNKSLEHLQKGLMRPIEYDSLNASIFALKKPVKNFSSINGLRAMIQDSQITKRSVKAFRLIKIKLFGLNLLK